ncbi:hypothetical protein ACFVH6_07450 [Spirillospora sp. NPDC127200]
MTRPSAEAAAPAHIEGVAARIARRILAMTAAIWRNRATSRPVTRSLIANDH